MLLVLVLFWLSSTCGLIDLQVPRALCLLETWRTQRAAVHHTGARTREKVLARKAPSLLWGVQSYHFWLCIPWALGAGPTLRSGKEVAPLPDRELVFFFVLYFFLSSSLSSPIWLPGSTLDPHPPDEESPVLEEFHIREGPGYTPTPGPK